MAIIKRFEDLQVWITSRELTNLIYGLTKTERFSKDFAFKDQIRRAAVSIMSNIAEGFDSETQALFMSYLSRARASAGEVRCHLYIAFDLEYISKDQFKKTLKLSEECSRQLFGFIKYLRSQPNTKRIK